MVLPVQPIRQRWQKWRHRLLQVACGHPHITSPSARFPLAMTARYNSIAEMLGCEETQVLGLRKHFLMWGDGSFWCFGVRDRWLGSENKRQLWKKKGFWAEDRLPGIQFGDIRNIRRCHHEVACSFSRYVTCTTLSFCTYNKKIPYCPTSIVLIVQR